MACWSGRFAVFTVAIALLVSVPATTAQEATPAASMAGRTVPRPAACTVEPRSPASLIALATPTTETVATTTPTAPTIPFGAFAGTPADTEIAAAYTAFIHLYWACENAGDFSRILANYSDRFLRQLVTPEDLLLYAQPIEGTPEPLAEAEWTAIFAIVGIQELADGRVGGYVVVDTAIDELPVEVNYMIASEAANGWQLDEFVCFDAAGTYCS